jgi:hypothetical protein
MVKTSIVALIALGSISLTHVAAAQSPADAPAVRLADSNDAAADETALAKKLQNPVGDLYTFPFQSNTNFNTGPNNGTQEILNIQPVVPIHVNADWNIITRTILPLIWQPSMAPGHTVPFGTGATTFTAFLSPSQPTNGLLWGVGPVVQVPTTSDPSLGSNVWGAGASGVLVFMKGPWVAGALANNVWSMGGTTGRGGTRYNTFLVQPFVNYNIPGGWYVGSSPVITANWYAAGNNAWTLPVGAQVGKVLKVGGVLPVNLLLGTYYNALRPQYGADWQLRTQATIIF